MSTSLFQQPPSDAEMRERRVTAARKESRWVEYLESELTPRGRYLVTARGDLLEPVRVDVYYRGDPRSVFNVSHVAAFYVDAAGEPRFLQAANPKTLAELEALEERRRLRVVR